MPSRLDPRAGPPLRRRLRRAVPLAALVLAAGVLAGCSTTPRAVLWVPGSYTADLWQPTLDLPEGSPTAAVLMCLDEASAVHLSTPGGGIRLDWGGNSYRSPPEMLVYAELTTPVLEPGCGTLVFSVDCCTIDHYLTITAEKVPPP